MVLHVISLYCMVLLGIVFFCTVSHCHVPLLQRAGVLPRSASSHFKIIYKYHISYMEANFIHRVRGSRFKSIIPSSSPVSSQSQWVSSWKSRGESVSYRTAAEAGVGRAALYWYIIYHHQHNNENQEEKVSHIALQQQQGWEGLQAAAGFRLLTKVSLGFTQVALSVSLGWNSWDQYWIYPLFHPIQFG